MSIGIAHIGPITISELSQYHVRIAFIGSDGLSCEHGLTTNFVEAAEVSRTMSAHCETTVLVADSAKLGKRGFTQVMPLSDVDILITDNGMDDAAVAQIEECGVSVRRV
jgi:DeoR/GlpR family transcriptional regulator of sugar metabolism